ncbi:MAG: tetratricopeptide repeat protein [Candidatus Thorarchaeota archaeon]
MTNLMCEGISHFGNMDISEARKCFEETIETDSKNGTAWMFLGDVFLLEGEIEQAEIAHQKADQINSDFSYPQVDANVKKGSATWEIRLEKDLISKIIYQDQIGVMFSFENGKTSFLTLNEPGNKERVVIPAMANTKLKRTESLLALLSPFYPVVGGMLAANLVLFESMILREIESRNASLQMKKAEDNNMEHSRVWAEQGMAYESIDQIEESALAYSKSLELDPKNYCAQRGIVKVLMRAKTEQKIIDHVRHPIAQSMIGELSHMAESPKWSQFKRSTSTIIPQNDVLSLALRSFVFSDQRDAVSLEALIYKGREYLDINDYQIAALFFERALRIEPNDRESLFGLTSSLIKMQKFSEAESYLSELVKIDPKNSDSWTKYGLSTLAVGKIELSESSFRKAIAIDSNNMLALLNLSTVLMEVGKCDEARSIMIQIQDEIPSEFMKVLQDAYGKHCM